MAAYYNEIDPGAAAWLRELISRDLIAPGDVDERDIRDVTPSDLFPYTQCHFFAGIGTWSYALRRAGWPDDREVWTGSPPCQPFSAAGRRAGTADERHLWPHYHHLIRVRGPREVFIEQVASKDGLAWLDLVQADLEGTGYAYWAADLCAAGFGAPHIRQRQYGAGRRLERLGDCVRERLEGYRRYGHGASGRSIEGGSVAAAGADGGVGDTSCESRKRDAGGISREEAPRDKSRQSNGREFDRHPDASTNGRMADDGCSRRDARLAGDTGSQEGTGRSHGAVADRRSTPGDLADVSGSGWREERENAQRVVEGDQPEGVTPGPRDGRRDRRPGPTNGFWRDADWLGCRDGKWRPVRPESFPLVDGAPARVGRLRGYGNGIVAEQAQAFIECYLEAEAASFDLGLVACSLEDLLS